MGLGSYPFGVGPFGRDPAITTARPSGTTPSALLFDVGTKQTLLDANGYAVSIDPIDQEVSLAIGVGRGTLTSSPDTGLDYERLLRASSDTVLAIARDAVNVALAAPLGRGDVRVLDVQAESGGGRVSLVVTYANLRTGQTGNARGVR